MGPGRRCGDRLGGDAGRERRRARRSAGQAGAAGRPRACARSRFRRARRHAGPAAGRSPTQHPAAGDARVHPQDARRDPLRRRPAAGLHLPRAAARREDHRPGQGQRRADAHLRGLSVEPAGAHLQAPGGGRRQAAAAGGPGPARRGAPPQRPGRVRARQDGDAGGTQARGSPRRRGSGASATRSSTTPSRSSRPPSSAATPSTGTVSWCCGSGRARTSRRARARAAT